MNIRNIEVIYRPPDPVGADPMNLTPTISIKMTTGSGEAYGLCLDASDEDGTPFDTERMIFAINLMLHEMVGILNEVNESEAEWIPYSHIVGEKQITGWLCGNCKKYSKGLRKYCPECGAKMKGV